MDNEDLVALICWAFTGNIPETECPISRETMWSDHYEWERDSMAAWIDFGGEG